MPDHDLKRLETALRHAQGGVDELLKLIYLKGFTTPREFALILGAAESIAQQTRTLVAVGKEMVHEGR